MQIMQMLNIIVQLLFVMILFALIGRPFIFFLKRRLRFFEELNFVQELVFDVYLGAILLYVIALIPLHLFNTLTIFAVLSFAVAFTSIQIIQMLKSKDSLTNLLLSVKKDWLEQCAVLALFMVPLVVQAAPLSVLVFGTVHDTSLFALFTQLILENNQIPATHLPYIPAAIVYPQGTAVIFAFATMILRVTPPLAVFHVTALFNAMIILAAYHFGKSLDRRKHAGLSFAFLFAFMSMWPLHLTWGLNAFVVGAPLFVLVTTFMGHYSHFENASKSDRILFYTVLGLLVGYMGAIHISLLLILILGLIIFIAVKFRNYRDIWRELKKTIIVLVISGILIAPFLYRFISYYNLPGQNIGLPTDIVSSTGSSALPLTDPHLNWETIKSFLSTMPLQYNLSPYPLTRAMTIILLICAPLLIALQTLKEKQRNKSVLVGLTLVIASIVFLLMEPIGLLATMSLRACFILYISLIMLLGSFNISLWAWLTSRVFRPKTAKTFALAIVVFASLYAPFIYYRLAEDPAALTRQYSLFAITTEDDYNLMLWIRDNLQQNATILVNPFEAGLFIPALSQRKIIYPFSAYHLSASYAETNFMIAEGNLDTKVYNYLKENNITHIYVGSKASAVLEVLGNREAISKWDPYLFLGNPNFKLARRVGDAYLFEFQSKYQQATLADSFEYASLDLGGWKTINKGDGEGNASIVTNVAFDGESSLMLYAESSNESYEASVFRKVYVNDSHSVTLSFHLNSTIGFGSGDYLMLNVSDSTLNKHLYFIANPPSSIASGIIRLDSSEGMFEFDLSTLWKDLHGEDLPKSFYIEITNCDSDGVKNVAYIDSIIIENQQ